MAPPLGKLSVSTKKASSAENSLNNSTPQLNSPVIQSAVTPTPVTSKAQNAFAKLRTLSVVSGRKRASSMSSKHSLSTENGSFLTFNLEEERSISSIDEKKLNSLHKAVFDNDIKKVKKLLADNKREIDKLDTNHQFTALYLAVHRNNYDMAEYLLTVGDSSNKKSDPNVTCFKGRTSLMMAVINENLKIVKILLQNGAKVNLADDWKCRPLTYALTNQNTDIIEALLDARPEVQYQDTAHMTCLHHAARLGRPDMAALLIRNGHEVDARDDLDRTPLHISVKEKQVTVVGILLSNKANVEAQDMNCQTVLDYFSYSSFSQELWNILQEYRALHKSTLSLANKDVAASSLALSSPTAAPITTASPPTSDVAQAHVIESDLKQKVDDELSSVMSISSQHSDAYLEAQVPSESIEAHADKTSKDTENNSTPVTGEKYQSMFEKFNEEIASLTERYNKEKSARQAQETTIKKATEKLRIVEKELDDLRVLQTNREREVSTAASIEQQALLQRYRSETVEKDRIIEDLESTTNFLTKHLQGKEALRPLPLIEQPSSESLVNGKEKKHQPGENSSEEKLKQRVVELEKLILETDKAIEQAIYVSKSDLGQFNQHFRKTRETIHAVSKNQLDSGYAVSPSSHKQALSSDVLAESILKSVKYMTENLNIAKQGIEGCLNQFNDTPIIEVFTVQLATMHDLISTWQKDSQWIESNVSALKEIQKSEQTLQQQLDDDRQSQAFNDNNIVSFRNTSASSRPTSSKGRHASNHMLEEAQKEYENKIKVLDGTRRRHETVIVKYEKEISMLKEELNALKSSSDDQKVHALQQKLTAQSVEYDNSLAVIKATLEADVRRLEDESGKLKQERDKLYAQVQFLNKELELVKVESEKNAKFLRDERESHKNILARKDEIYSMAESNKESIIKENEELKDQMAQQHADARAKMNKLEREHAEVYIQLKKVNDLEAEYTAQIDSLQDEITQLKTKNETMQQEMMQEVVVLQEEKSELSHHVEEFKSETQTLQAKIQQLVQSSESMSSTHTVLLQAKEKDIQALCQQLDQLEKEKQYLINEKSLIAQTLEQKTKEILEFISRIQDLESALEREKSQVLELRKNVEHLQDQTSRIEDLQRDTAELQVYQQRASFLNTQLIAAQEQLETKESQYRETQQLKLEYETQVQSLTQDLEAKERRLQDLVIQCESLSQKQTETNYLETMLHQQHEEMLTQLRKYGLDLSMSFQQGASTLNSFEMYLHAEKEARGLYERQLTQMQEKHNEQVNQYKSNIFENQKKISLFEMKQSTLEKDLVDRKVAYSVLNEKWIHLEAKNADLLRKNSSMMHEMTSFKADNHVQNLNLTNKIERLENENNKLKFKVQELIREHQLKLSHLSNQYDVQIEKMVKRMQFAGQQRLSIDQSRKKNQQTLLDTYEQHIKALTNELNVLRLTALKHQVSQCRKGL